MIAISRIATKLLVKPMPACRAGAELPRIVQGQPPLGVPFQMFEMRYAMRVAYRLLSALRCLRTKDAVIKKRIIVEKLEHVPSLNWKPLRDTVSSL